MIVNANERFDGRPALDFVVVTADNRFFAANVGLSQQGQESFGQIRGGWRRAVGRRLGWGGRRPGSFQCPQWNTLVQKIEIDIANDSLTVVQSQTTPGFKVANTNCFDILANANLLEVGPVGRRYGQDHPLLGLAEPDFPGTQTGIFKGHDFQLHVCAQAFGHFAHGRRESTCAAIGDGVVKLLVAGAQDHFKDLFLVNGMADLHRATSNLAGGLVHLHTGEGGATQAISSRASPNDNNQVTRLGSGGMATVGKKSQATTKDQGISGVARVIEDSAVDRGNAHFVAVIFDAVDDPVGNAAGMENAAR